MEYRSIENKSSKPGEQVDDFSGRFRVEGNAVFAGNRKVQIASRAERQETFKRLAQGDRIELSVPNGAEEKRIGEYQRSKNGRIRLSSTTQIHYKVS